MKSVAPTFLSHDLVASLVVFLVALPLCMGIAIASGMPPAAGLLTGIIGGVVVGAIAGSPLQVSGPAAGLAVIVFELIRDHGVAMLGPILLLAGAMQLLAGVCRLGEWFRAISPAVVYGMLAGIGVIIIGAQFHVMLDGTPQPNGLANLTSIPGALIDAFNAGGARHGMTAGLLGFLTIATMVVWERHRPARVRFLPGALIGVMLAALVAAAFDLPVRFVDVPADLWQAIAWPTAENLGRLVEPPILLTAAAVAFIASAETLLSAGAVDQMHAGPRTDYNRELAAQGLGNILCGGVGALPMTGVIVRSSANVQAGARTRLSTVLHGVWLLALVVLLPDVLGLVPICSLAGVLVYTGYKPVNPSHLRRLAQYGRAPVSIYLATLIAIIATDLLTGVLVGLGLSLAKLVWHVTPLRVQLHRDEARRRADLVLAGTATFLGLPRLARVLDDVPAGTVLHLRTERLTYIDHACMELLSTWARQNAQKGSRLVVEWDALHRRSRQAA